MGWVFFWGDGIVGFGEIWGWFDSGGGRRRGGEEEGVAMDTKFCKLLMFVLLICFGCWEN